MSKKFVRVKRFIIPVLTAALLLAQSATAFALSPKDVAALEAAGVQFEMLSTEATQSTEAPQSTEDFEIQGTILKGYRGKGGDVIVPAGITKIGDVAFALEDGVTSVTLPDSVTEIGMSAFMNCDNLVSVTVPDGLTKIWNSAFHGCDKLESFVVPSGVTSLESGTFRKCTALKAVVIPSSVESIRENVFEDSPNVTIYGEAGSAAELFAQAKGIPFKAIVVNTQGEATPNTPANSDQTPSNSVATGPKDYADVPDTAWYAEAAKALSEGGLITGYSDGLFHPNDPITKGQLATILCRIGGLDTNNFNFQPRSFDLYTYGVLELRKPYDWATQAISSIWDAGVYRINPETSGEIVNRAEALTAVVRVACHMPEYYESGVVGQGPRKQISEKVWHDCDIPDFDVVKVYTQDNTFTVSSYCVLAAYNLGITKGVDEKGSCRGDSPITRAELAQMLFNMGVTNANSVVYITGEGD